MPRSGYILHVLRTTLSVFITTSVAGRAAMSILQVVAMSIEWVLLRHALLAPWKRRTQQVRVFHRGEKHDGSLVLDRKGTRHFPREQLVRGGEEHQCRSASNLTSPHLTSPLVGMHNHRKGVASALHNRNPGGAASCGIRRWWGAVPTAVDRQIDCCCRA